MAAGNWGVYEMGVYAILCLMRTLFRNLSVHGVRVLWRQVYKILSEYVTLGGLAGLLNRAQSLHEHHGMSARHFLSGNSCRTVVLTAPTGHEPLHQVRLLSDVPTHSRPARSRLAASWLAKVSSLIRRGERERDNGERARKSKREIEGSSFSSSVSLTSLLFCCQQKTLCCGHRCVSPSHSCCGISRFQSLVRSARRSRRWPRSTLTWRVT